MIEVYWIYISRGGVRPSPPFFPNEFPKVIFHLSVVELNGRHWNQLLFRNYLRQHLCDMKSTKTKSKADIPMWHG
jgi:hypothetical protein